MGPVERYCIAGGCTIAVMRITPNPFRHNYSATGEFIQATMGGFFKFGVGVACGWFVWSVLKHKF
jgi:hypothetical protein